MTDRRKYEGPISELYSPDQRTGGGDRKHLARSIRKLKAKRQIFWSHHLLLSTSHNNSYIARRLPRIAP